MPPDPPSGARDLPCLVFTPGYGPAFGAVDVPTPIGALDALTTLSAVDVATTFSAVEIVTFFGAVD